MKKSKSPYMISFILNLLLGIFFFMIIFMFFLALSTQTGYTFSTHNSYILEAKKLYHSLYVYLFLYLVVIILANVLLIKLHERKKRTYKNKKYFFISIISFLSPSIYIFFNFIGELLKWKNTYLLKLLSIYFLLQLW